MIRLQQQGFTAIELTLILVILAILSTVILPRFFTRTDFTERAFYSEVISDLRYAQKRAVASGCPIQVAVDGAAGTYTLSRGKASCDDAELAPLINPKTGAAYPAVAPADVNITDVAGFPISFNALGQASNDASLKINARSIAIVGETGLVHEP